MLAVRGSWVHRPRRIGPKAGKLREAFAWLRFAWYVPLFEVYAQLREIFQRREWAAKSRADQVLKVQADDGEREPRRGESGTQIAWVRMRGKLAPFSGIVRENQDCASPQKDRPKRWRAASDLFLRISCVCAAWTLDERTETCKLRFRYGDFAKPDHAQPAAGGTSARSRFSSAGSGLFLRAVLAGPFGRRVAPGYRGARGSAGKVGPRNLAPAAIAAAT